MEDEWVMIFLGYDMDKGAVGESLLITLRTVFHSGKMIEMA
jgi:hypothetical protein